MPTTWAELLELGDREPVGGDGAPAEADEAPARRGFFRRLRASISTSREALSAEISSSLFETLDTEAWERLEEALIMADVGARTTAEVVGVNGTGKTTTVGKLAWHLQKEAGLKVMLAAADTYRAAAVEQLGAWAERAGCDIVKAETGQDSGAVVFDAIEAAEARGSDVVLIDTAGRLHTRNDLMEELAKVGRVIEKRIGRGPSETLIVVDSTTGQNGLRQAKVFSEAVDVTGVALTKLDGTAKGGIALAIAGELGIPVKLIGIGEGIEDLRPFDAEEFSAALVGA